MRKLLFLSALFLSVLTGCAQNDKKESVPAVKMTESEMQKALAPLFDKFSAIPVGENSRPAAAKISLEYAKENHNDAGTYVVINFLANLMPADEFLAFVEGDEYYKNDEKVKANLDMIRVKSATSEGKMFVDFQAEYAGKVTKLSDYVGKGKYVLVDFWASWCGPCKKEIPNIIKVWEKYHGDKFEVLGVATWDEPDKTIQAIEALGIKYPQMLNAQKAGSDAYGIAGIPEIILFGPDGTIVKRGLRGADIEKSVEEALK